MRGKVYFENKYRHVKRITPAYAGKSPVWIPQDREATDHPRLCGEKLCNYKIIAAAKGSPPPMRGKGYLEPFYSIYHRITPAYAGKSCLLMFGSQICEDHPRLCGEKCMPQYPQIHSKGSPPPMRGKVIR